MYHTLKILYCDGTKQNLETEPMRRNMAKELMLNVFYGQSAEEGSDQIVSIRFFSSGKGKPLAISRNAL